MNAPAASGRNALRGVLSASAFGLAVIAIGGPSCGFIGRPTATVLGLGAVLLFGGLLLSFRSRTRGEDAGEGGRPSRPVPLPHWSPAPGVVPDVMIHPGGTEPTLEPEARRVPLDTPPPDPEDPTVDVFPAPPEEPDRGEV
jgi:hypothetical protein